MNLFAITSLLVSVCCFGLAIFIFTIAKTKLHKLWAFFNFACFLWAIGTFFAAISKSPLSAEISWRWTYGLGAIVPCVFYHFICAFCALKRKRILNSFYVMCALFVLTNLFSPSFIKEVTFVFDSFYYNKATIHFSMLMIYLIVLLGLAFKELFIYYRISSGIKIQI